MYICIYNIYVYLYNSMYNFVSELSSAFSSLCHWDANPRHDVIREYMHRYYVFNYAVYYDQCKI